MSSSDFRPRSSYRTASSDGIPEPVLTTITGKSGSFASKHRIAIPLRVDTYPKSDSQKRTAADGLCRRRPYEELLLLRFRCGLDSAHNRSPLIGRGLRCFHRHESARYRAFTYLSWCHANHLLSRAVARLYQASSAVLGDRCESSRKPPNYII